MGGQVPKQFLELGGEPIAMRTLRRVSESVDRFLTQRSQYVDGVVDKQAGGNRRIQENVDNYVHKILLVLPESYIQSWRTLCEKHRFRVPHTVVAGGETRFHSVRNGLAAEPEAEIVLVHDGVRPFVDDRTVAAVIAAAERYGAAVPVVPVTDSLRRIEGPNGTASRAVDRTEYRAVQTPQGFRGDRLRQAYTAPYDERFTDDATVVELTGTGRIVWVDGDPANIKITTPTDRMIAEAMLDR